MNIFMPYNYYRGEQDMRYVHVSSLVGLGACRFIARRGYMMRNVTMKRVCLRCGRRFVSLSCANRICGRCKETRFGCYADPMRVDDRELAAVGMVRDGKAD
jgi:hypothetical protein